MSSLISRRRATLAYLIALTLVLAAQAAHAQDVIVKTDGSQINGQITGVDGGQVLVQNRSANGGIAQGRYYLTDVRSVTMDPPADVAKLQGANATPAVVVTTLEPEVKKFAGLPADWVVTAMSQLAQAYAAQNKDDKASAIYTQIDTLYPGSKYHAQAIAGKALLSLKTGKVDDALAAVQPIIDQANKDLAPSPTDGALYASAYLVYGQAL